jgi:tetratricopeptide (TPR) repeat protein
MMFRNHLTKTKNLYNCKGLDENASPLRGWLPFIIFFHLSSFIFNLFKGIRVLPILLCMLTQIQAQPELELKQFAAEDEAWMAREYDNAIALIKAKPPETVNLYNLGYLYWQKNDLDTAQNYFHQALKADSSYYYTYLSLAQIHVQKNEVYSAKNILKQGLTKDEDNYHLLLLLGKVYLLLQQSYEAEKIFTVLVEDHEDQFEPRTYLSQIYRNQKKYEQALPLFIIDDSLYPDAYFLQEKALVLESMGNLSAANRIRADLCNDYPNSKELGCTGNSDQAFQPNHGFKYQIDLDEHLDYKVKYGFITLGWVNVRVAGKKIINGREVFHIIFFVNSNTAFDFLISLHHIYESYVDAYTLAPIQSRLFTPNEKFYKLRTYYYDYSQNHFDAFLVGFDGRFNRVQKPMPKMAHDGMSLLYYARGLVSNQANDTMTVIIDEEYKWTTIEYLNEREEIEIKDEDINAIKIFAQAKFSGIAGMNGDAWGWFSPDRRSEPLEGKIKIILGYITVTKY